MPYFDSAGVQIWYEDRGAGDAVVLVHGFASDASHNWGETGWIELLAARYRVLAPDGRGHGRSGKPHTSDAYGYEGMGADVIRIMDRLGIGRALLMGYSRGGSIAISLMLHHPERLRAVVLGGIAYDDGLEDPADRQAIVDAYRAPDASKIASPLARGYREFAESRGNDLVALAALMEGDRTLAPRGKFEDLNIPTMIVAGSRDNLIGDPRELAAMIPRSRLLILDGRDHLNAPADARYKEAVLEFFASAPR